MLSVSVQITLIFGKDSLVYEPINSSIKYSQNISCQPWIIFFDLKWFFVET